MSHEKIKDIQVFLEEFLHKAGFADSAVSFESELSGEDETLTFSIQTQSGSQFLIGKYGDNLRDFQFIFRMMARKKFGDDTPNFVLDVNGYREQKNKMIVDMAQEAAHEALRDGKVVIMRSMSAYERRLAHMTLSKNDEVVTESVGEGIERRVAVKPTGLDEEV